jgi:hypothetical protein|tara:strand:- start:71 stop:727 length:657 start_codon:yes stop_codon:yes gene_type:complete
MREQNIPTGWHISKGADSVFFILNNGENYYGKLSTDLETAKLKAKQKLGFDVPVNIWHRFGWKKVEKTERLPFQFDHIDTHIAYINKIEFEEYKKSIKNKYSKFSHVGNVGDKLDLELTITEIFTYPIQTERWIVTGYGHKFVDKDNNKLIYFGNSKQFLEEYETEYETIKLREIYKVGDKISVKATIKEHTTDIKDIDTKTQIGMPLTVLARPKVNK